MALEPADRYATPRALADDVEHWLADEPVTAYREPVVARLGAGAAGIARGWPAQAVLLLTATAALGIGLVAVNEQKNRTEAARRSRTERARGGTDAQAAEQEAKETAQAKKRRRGRARIRGERVFAAGRPKDQEGAWVTMSNWPMPSRRPCRSSRRVQGPAADRGPAAHDPGDFLPVPG